jgi:nucleoside phosphorylase
VLALSSTGDKTARLNREPQIFPAIHIQALEEDMPDWKSQLVSLVTRHPNVNVDVVNKVLEKNQTHQLDRTLLLVDKQGVAAYVPSGTTSDAVNASLARFENSVAMLQLGAVLRLKLRAKVGLTDDERWAITSPNEVVPASVSGRRIWSLFVLEFLLSTWLNPMKPLMDIFPPPRNQEMLIAPATLMRILLVTVTSVETQALQEVMIEATGREPVVRKISGFPYKDFGQLGDYEVWHQISGMGSGGIDGSQEAVRRGILDVKPAAVLMIGIAFGVDPKTQPIGTILVSQQIQTYELQRVNKDTSITLRGDKVTASPMLLNWVSFAEVEWPEGEPKLKKGLVLSGEKLVDNQDFRDQLVQIAPGALGGEMEGAGVYVASQTAKVDWLLVKAVCDWADGNKAKDKDKLQAKAAMAAAKFSVLMLRTSSERPL